MRIDRLLGAFLRGLPRQRFPLCGITLILNAGFQFTTRIFQVTELCLSILNAFAEFLQETAQIRVPFFEFVYIPLNGFRCGEYLRSYGYIQVPVAPVIILRINEHASFIAVDPALTLEFCLLLGSGSFRLA